MTLHIRHDPSLHATVRTFNEATNHFLRIGHGQNTWSKKTLQAEGYYAARASWPNLQSSLVQGARDVASEALKQCRNATLPIKKPDSSARFNQRTFKAYLETGSLSVSTVSGRKRIPITIPRYFHYARDGTVSSLRVANTSHGHRIDLVVKLPDPTPLLITQYTKVLGVDRGMLNIAVTSDGDFYDSKQLRQVRGRMRYLKARLQAKGTRSAKRHLRRLARRERRFQANANHRIAKSIAAKDYDAVALEDLNIRTRKGNGKRFNRALGGWAYAHLEQVLAYKLEAAGKTLVKVDPAYTSRSCCRCGAIGTRKRHDFTCVCGLRLHADLNAARNIAQRGNAVLGRPGVNGPIVACDATGTGVLVKHSYKPPTSFGGS